MPAMITPIGKPPETAALTTTTGGEMAALIRATDWNASVLGPTDTWSQSLKTILRILVTSRYAMWMGWGPELTFFYNDAYAPTLGVKHSRALGQPASQVWAEIWKDIGPRAESVMQTGIATWDEGLLLFLERSGYPEETYHTFSYSPLPDDDGSVAGMLCVVTEETQRVIGERRLDTLRDLGSALGAVRSEPEVIQAVERSLTRNDKDLPFVLIYLQDGETGTLRRVVATHGMAAPAMAAQPEALPFPVASVLSGTDRHVIHDLGGLPGLVSGAWDQPPRLAVIVPIAQQGLARPAGVFITGLNPYRPYDEAYAGFIDLVAAQIASGLGAARAYEAERRRAEALAQIDQAKTAFFSNVSHEFRTPLTLMLGPLEEEIAERVGSQPEAAQRLAMVHRNGLRLLRLVNTLLDFSSIEAGRVRARYQPTELGAYTEELASNFRSACDRAGLRLATNCAVLDRPVYVDTEMWERIVLNLLSNAFKYTLAGGITVALQAAPQDQAAVLTVSDTGIGIPAAELPHVFDRFHRIEGQRGRTLEGTGIGLALVNELVRLHGGSIAVESRVDVGTTISVRIPFGSAHLPPDRVSETAARTLPEGTAAAAFVEEALRWLPGDGETADAATLETPSLLTSLGVDAIADGPVRRRILLADDNADMREYVVRLLQPGYEVEAVADGQAALLAARANPPDLILSDVMMPRLDGFGMLAALRADPALRDLPVMLVSARAGEEARVEGLDAGADDYLVKPFSARELLARVRSNLELARLRQQARDALQQVNETLEQRVAEEMVRRTRAEESLRQAQKMEAIGHLTGGVAHDFNNLLTVIGGGVETLQRILATVPLGGDEPRITRALAMIAQGADRAATLTHRLLAFARRQTLDPRPLDPNKLVAGMSELLRRSLGESVALETVLAGGLWRTIADANQLENALLNLAVNARDAMPEGGKLTIETANTYLDEAYAAAHDDVAPGQYVMIAVSDTGSGMDPLTLSRVFEPFFTTKDIGQGTGLGLSQVYGFIKQSNGHVKLYSEPGQGTAVKLYLPRLLSDRSESPPKPADEQVPIGNGETILVVEDEPAVREHSVASLRELGYRVLAAGDGHAALRILARETGIAVLFTDVGLPGGMTGRQLAEAARAQRPDLKVLYTTGYARNAIVHGGVLDPGTELLPKPFSYAALATKIRAVLDG